MVCVINTVVDGVGAYATSDILAPHPTKPGYWKVFGRADDQIMHSTGEKVSPPALDIDVARLMRDFTDEPWAFGYVRVRV